jgi:hypothetical protein
MASQARRIRLIASLAASSCLAFACTRGASEVRATWTLEPTQPSTDAPTVVRFVLERAEDTPVKGARLHLEAHMTHPGMAPLTGEVTERGDGVYESRVKFSMAGTWLLVISGELANGRRIVKQKEVTAAAPTG